MSTSTSDETRNDIATPIKKASRKTARKQAGDGPSAAAAVTAEERRNMIAVAAYYRSQARGFEPGNEHEDWLLAEREVDRILGR